MAIKKITLTEDHIKLIQAIKFEEFDFSDRFSTMDISYSMEEIADAVQGGDVPKKLEGPLINLQSYLMRVKEKLERMSEEKSRHGWGIDQWSLFGGTYVFEDIALILGKLDQRIPGTEEDPLGGDFPEDLKNYMWELYEYIYKNMKYIISLVLFYAGKGGLTPGTYKCIDYERIWERVD